MTTPEEQAVIEQASIVANNYRRAEQYPSFVNDRVTDLALNALLGAVEALNASKDPRVEWLQGWALQDSRSEMSVEEAKALAIARIKTLDAGRTFSMNLEKFPFKERCDDCDWAIGASDDYRVQEGMAEHRRLFCSGGKP